MPFITGGLFSTISLLGSRLSIQNQLPILVSIWMHTNFSQNQQQVILTWELSPRKYCKSWRPNWRKYRVRPHPTLLGVDHTRLRHQQAAVALQLSNIISPQTPTDDALMGATTPFGGNCYWHYPPPSLNKVSACRHTTCSLYLLPPPPIKKGSSYH